MTDGRCKQIFAQKRRKDWTKSGGRGQKGDDTGWGIEDVNKFFTRASVDWHGWLGLKWNWIPCLIVTKTRCASSKKIIKCGVWRKIFDTPQAACFFYQITLFLVKNYDQYDQYRLHISVTCEIPTIMAWWCKLSKHHAAVINSWPQLPTDRSVQISAQTGTDGCERKQNADNEQFLSLPFNFLSVFINGYTKRKITSNGQFWITQRLSHLSHSIFQSTFFHVNITTNKLWFYSSKAGTLSSPQAFLVVIF